MRDMFPIRDRVDAFVRGLGQTGEDMARIPLAGSPRTISVFACQCNPESASH